VSYNIFLGTFSEKIGHVAFIGAQRRTDRRRTDERHLVSLWIRPYPTPPRGRNDAVLHNVIDSMGRHVAPLKHGRR